MRQPNLPEDTVAQLEIARRADVAGMRYVDVDDLLDRSRAGAHHHDAIGQLHSFIDVVRHKDNGLALRFPDP